MAYLEHMQIIAGELRQLWSQTRSIDRSPLLPDENDNCTLCLPMGRRVRRRISQVMELTSDGSYQYTKEAVAQYEEKKRLNAHQTEIHGPINFVINRVPEHLNEFLSPKSITNRDMLTYYDPKELSGSSEPAIAFFLLNGHRIGDIRFAEMIGEHSSLDSELSLYDNEGKRIALRGCRSGYNGHGPNGTLSVLRLAGFPEGRTLDLQLEVTDLSNIIRTQPAFRLLKA